MKGLVIGLSIILCIPDSVQHGYLEKPPQRGSLWRFGYPAPPNYNDNELYCGGVKALIRAEGKCGPCGDPYYGNRAHEAGGKYALGIIAETLPKGTTKMKVKVKVSSYHMGYFSFHLCVHNNPRVPVSQECLDKTPLKIIEGSSAHDYFRYYPEKPWNRAEGDRYEMNIEIPKGITCSQCVLQWIYKTGNSWGTNKDGVSCLGCGMQEEFRNCADISIGDSNNLDAESNTHEISNKIAGKSSKLFVDLDLTRTVAPPVFRQHTLKPPSSLRNAFKNEWKLLQMYREQHRKDVIEKETKMRQRQERMKKLKKSLVRGNPLSTQRNFRGGILKVQGVSPFRNLRIQNNGHQNRDKGNINSEALHELQNKKEKNLNKQKSDAVSRYPIQNKNHKRKFTENVSKPAKDATKRFRYIIPEEMIPNLISVDTRTENRMRQHKIWLEVTTPKLKTVSVNNDEQTLGTPLDGRESATFPEINSKSILHDKRKQNIDILEHLRARVKPRANFNKETKPHRRIFQASDGIKDMKSGVIDVQSRATQQTIMSKPKFRFSQRIQTTTVTPVLSWFKKVMAEVEAKQAQLEKDKKSSTPLKNVNSVSKKRLLSKEPHLSSNLYIGDGVLLESSTYKNSAGVSTPSKWFNANPHPTHRDHEPANEIIAPKLLLQPHKYISQDSTPSGILKSFGHSNFEIKNGLPQRAFEHSFGINSYKYNVTNASFPAQHDSESNNKKGISVSLRQNTTPSTTKSPGLHTFEKSIGKTKIILELGNQSTKSNSDQSRLLTADNINSNQDKESPSSTQIYVKDRAHMKTQEISYKGSKMSSMSDTTTSSSITSPSIFSVPQENNIQNSTTSIRASDIFKNTQEFSAIGNRNLHVRPQFNFRNNILSHLASASNNQNKNPEVDGQYESMIDKGSNRQQSTIHVTQAHVTPPTTFDKSKSEDNPILQNENQDQSSQSALPKFRYGTAALNDKPVGTTLPNSDSFQSTTAAPALFATTSRIKSQKDKNILTEILHENNGLSTSIKSSKLINVTKPVLDMHKSMSHSDFNIVSVSKNMNTGSTEDVISSKNHVHSISTPGPDIFVTNLSENKASFKNNTKDKVRNKVSLHETIERTKNTFASINKQEDKAKNSRNYTVGIDISSTNNPELDPGKKVTKMNTLTNEVINGSFFFHMNESTYIGGQYISPEKKLAIIHENKIRDSERPIIRDESNVFHTNKSTNVKKQKNSYTNKTILRGGTRILHSTKSTNTSGNKISNMSTATDGNKMNDLSRNGGRKYSFINKIRTANNISHSDFSTYLNTTKTQRLNQSIQNVEMNKNKNNHKMKEHNEISVMQNHNQHQSKRLQNTSAGNSLLLSKHNSNKAVNNDHSYKVLNKMNRVFRQELEKKYTRATKVLAILETNPKLLLKHPMFSGLKVSKQALLRLKRRLTHSRNILRSILLGNNV